MFYQVIMNLAVGSDPALHINVGVSISVFDFGYDTIYTLGIFGM